jgi:hypothetical protein
MMVNIERDERSKKEKNYWRIVSIGALGFIILSVLWGIFAHRLIHPGEVTGKHTTKEVEITVAATSNGKDGRVQSIYCAQLTEATWKCTVRYKDGRTVIKLATWYARNKSLGVSTIEQR